MNRKILFAALFTMLVLLIQCSKRGYSENGESGSYETHTVYMRNGVFSNSNVIITAGGTVKWVNDDDKLHTVTAGDGSFDSGDMPPGATYSRTFHSPGTYRYHCIYHSGMTATVMAVVK